MQGEGGDPVSLPDETAGYYELGLEQNRLGEGARGELEFVRTVEIIRRYLADPPGVVVDVGGGPGAYALWLAREGYAVHLIDPVPLHLEQARQASGEQPETPIQSISLGDARQLQVPDAFADAVLLLGPLYHLTAREDRLAALQEARRALKPGGVLFAVGISRFASTFAGLIEGYLEDPDFVRIVRRDLAEGQHRNPTGNSKYFTTAFFHHPQELEAEVAEAGFALETVLAIEGAAVFLQNLEAQWGDRARRERVLDVVRWLEAEPSVMGVTGHLMAIAARPA